MGSEKFRLHSFSASVRLLTLRASGGQPDSAGLRAALAAVQFVEPRPEARAIRSARVSYVVFALATWIESAFWAGFGPSTAV